MIFFDYEKCFLLSHGNVALLLKYIELIPGDNFIVNEKVVIDNPYKLTKLQLANYVGLCSLRNYSDYKIHGDPNLDISFVPPWVPKIVIEQCPLIEIKSSQLIYKEEN